jgi:hypothetical protein
VLSRRDEPFPFDAVLDLLGIVRAMWHAQRELDPSAAMVLARIASVGADLRGALELAERSTPGTVGYYAAWARAERATSRVSSLVMDFTPAQPIVKAAMSRVRRGG